ncbi:MAG: hypothetical protein JWO13_1843 [Acidobacteriales bacterium]|nr:hypothetical protein [Terriglobales bacterium]
MGWIKYNNCLTFGVSDLGFYLAVLPIFRFQHPPLLIPWREIRLRNGKGLIFSYKELILGPDEEVTLRIRRRAADELKNMAGANWPSEE